MPTGSIGPDSFFDDPRYLMESLSFDDLRTVLLGLCAAATVFRIVSGGADWASRVMLTLTAAEPGRARLFLTRGVLVGGLCTAATALCGLLLVPCLLLAAQLRGSTEGLDAVYWVVLVSQFLRGIVLVGLPALLGYSLAVLPHPFSRTGNFRTLFPTNEAWRGSSGSGTARSRAGKRVKSCSRAVMLSRRARGAPMQ